MSRARHRAAPLLALALLSAPARGGAATQAVTSEPFTIRGVPQTLHLYGARGGRPVIVTSGDGGFVHLGPDVAAFLASEGCFVVGFDAKAYLAGFTGRSGPLSTAVVPRDYAALVEYASRGSSEPPLLVGVSEGAGLSLLAATAPDLKPRIAGVVALGLPERSELAWRFRDSLIYLTHKTPDEPTFSAREIVDQVAPLPLAALHATHDEFVPLPEVQAILAAAREPKRLWVIEASDHRFSDNRDEFRRRLREAIEWIRSQRDRAR